MNIQGREGADSWTPTHPPNSGLEWGAFDSELGLILVTQN